MRYALPGHAVRGFGSVMASGGGRVFRNGSLGVFMRPLRGLGAESAQSSVGLSTDMMIGIVLGAAGMMVYLRSQEKGTKTA